MKTMKGKRRKEIREVKYEYNVLQLYTKSMERPLWGKIQQIKVENKGEQAGEAKIAIWEQEECI